MSSGHEHIGARLKRVRRSRGVTGKEVALAVGTTRTHLCAIESGRVASPRYELVRAVAEYFGLTMSELVGDLPVADAGLSAELEQIRRWYAHELSDEGRAVVFRMIQGYSANESQKDSTNLQLVRERSAG